MRKLALGLLAALSLIATAAPAHAQVCPAVAALPDTERRVSYSPSASTGPFSVTFAILGDSTDAGNWIEVWLDDVKLTYTTDWTFSLSGGGSVATACRPITTGQVTLVTAATGTLEIVGARRPRRLSQFSENQGVSARDLNRVITDIVAENRETWDRLARAIQAPPGEVLSVMPPAATRAGKFFYFDATGLIPQFTTGAAGTGNVVGPPSSTSGHLALWDNTTGTLLRDASLSSVLVTGLCSTSGAFPIYNATTAAWVCSTVGGTGSLMALTGAATTFSINKNAISANGSFIEAIYGSGVSPVQVTATPVGIHSFSTFLTTGATDRTNIQYINLFTQVIVPSGTGGIWEGMLVRAETSGTWSPSGSPVQSGPVALYALATTSRGGFAFGANTYCLTLTVAAAQCVSIEADTDVRVATTDKIGLQVADIATSTAAVSGLSAAVHVGAQAGAAGYERAFNVSAANGVFPLRTTATALKVTGGTITIGVDFTDAVISSGNGMILPNATHYAARNAANGATIKLLGLDSGDLLALYNGAVRINSAGTIVPSANDAASLGTSTVSWSDLFLAEGGVINWDNGDVTITQTGNILSFAGATTRYEFDANLTPTTSDGAALGTSALMWSDLFLASGGVINFNAGNVTITHSANVLTHAGASSGYIFDAFIQVATIRGGTGVGSDLTLQTTSGVGDGTDTFIFKCGNNGATTCATLSSTSLTFGGYAYTSGANTTFDTGVGVSTGNTFVEIGGQRTGDGIAGIDLHAQTGTDYDARFIRFGGANGVAQILNNGTGTFSIGQVNVGQIDFLTSNTAVLSIQSTGILKFGVNSFQANGTGAVTITAVAPAGVATATITKWLRIDDASGVDTYIALWQ